MAAHIDRTRIADELQRRSWNRFRKHRDDGADSRSGRGGNRDRDDGADGGPFFLVYMPNGIDVVVVMDSRTMVMISVLRMVRHRVNVECERLDLQRAQGQHDKNREAASHSWSVFHGPMGVNVADPTVAGSSRFLPNQTPHK